MRFAASPPIDGTLTGFYTSPEDFCYKLPEHVSLQEGALIEAAGGSGAYCEASGD